MAYTCGIFSAMNLFVEITLPTSIVLNCKSIVTLKDTKYDVKLMWGKEEIDNFCEVNHYDIRYLLENINPNIAFYHPVKLSKWKL